VRLIPLEVEFFYFNLQLADSLPMEVAEKSSPAIKLIFLTGAEFGEDSL